MIFLTLVLSVARQIENHRVKKSKNIVFSYRLKCDEDGRLFDPNYSFKAFQAEVSKRKRAQNNKVMVSCDIASYYDRINLHRLNSVLLSLEGVDGDIARLIDELLLFWSGRNSYGLPIGSNASRILAEAELVEVDNFLLEHGVSFCRYVDDYRIFAPDAMRANRDLELLVYALKREGLFLNSGKTKIDDVSLLTAETAPTDGQIAENNPAEAMRPLIINGYSGLIPVKYRKPTPSELEKLATLDIDAELHRMIKEVVLDGKRYRNLIKATEAQGKFDKIIDIVQLTEKCPQFIPYVVDYAKKNKNNLCDQKRLEIGDYFAPVFLSNGAPEFIRTSLSDLYSSEGYRRINLIVRAYLSLQVESGEYLGRVFLERVAGATTRLETLDLRDRGRVMDLNELRALARVVAKGLPDSEANAYLKNLSIHYDDLFLKQREILKRD